MGLYATILCTGMAVILVLYSILGQPHVEYIQVPLITGNKLLKPTCVAKTNVFDAILFASEGVALQTASYLCYYTKGATDAVNESKYIARGSVCTEHDCLLIPGC